MSVKTVSVKECRLRLDPTLVAALRRLPGGVGDVGAKIVRDFGLRYVYDKEKQTFDIFGPDPDILDLGSNTLRDWVDGKGFPENGVTCHLGYPNRGMVVWRFHGETAKKFDYLFTQEIARLKLIYTVNVKAVPSKRNPEYVELYAHSSMYHKVRDEVRIISDELNKICKDDFFIPKSDFDKAKKFAMDKTQVENVLFAIKSYPDDKIRVWMFARDNAAILLARRTWINHVGLVARNNQFDHRTVRVQSNDIRTASFYGHDVFAEQPTKPPDPERKRNSVQLYGYKALVTKKKPPEVSPRNPEYTPRYDNPNFARPSNFVYPIARVEPNVENGEPAGEPLPESLEQENETHKEAPSLILVNPLAGTAKWIIEDKQSNSRRAIPIKDNPAIKSYFLQNDAHGEKKSTKVKAGPRRKIMTKSEQPTQSVRYNITMNGLEIFLYKQRVSSVHNIDVLLNPVTSGLKVGGPIAKEMFKETGRQVQDEVNVHLSLYGDGKPGENVVTSAGRLSASGILGVIHVVVPAWREYTVWEDCANDLHKAVFTALKTAETHRYRSLAMPVIGVGM